MADVTVVIATRGRCAGLARTLEHLREVPVVVVDNGSADNTRAMVAERYPAMTLIALPRNAGAVARNHGLRAARTPYVAFADDDSWWAPGALDRAAAHFAAAPRLALVAARTLVGPDERLDPVAAFMGRAPLGTGADLPGPSVLGFLACAAVVRRDAFLATGGFDPVVFFMGEEARVALDLRTAGHGLAYCDDVVAHHHPDGGGGAARRADKRALAARNRALTAWMRRPVRIAAAASAVALADGRTAAQLLARLPAALARRRRVPAAVERELAVLAAAEAADRGVPAPAGWEAGSHVSR